MRHSFFFRIIITKSASVFSKICIVIVVKLEITTLFPRTFILIH